MDPITAFGVVSSAITLIEFAAGLVQKVQEIKVSSTSRTKQNDARYQSAESLWTLSRNLEGRINRIYGKLTPEEESIRKTALNCVEWAEALKYSLASVDSNGFVQSFAQALKSIWREKEIKEAEQFLEKARRNLSIQLNEAQLSKLSAIQKSLEVLIHRSDTLDAQADAMAQNLEKMQEHLLSTLQNASSRVPTTLDRANLHINKDVASDLTKLDEKIKEIFEAKVNCICGSLFFDKITARRQHVVERHKLTCDWIFDREHCQLLKWLENGNEVFWIKGKAGCGKSTTMKFLLSDARTLEALNVWARQRKSKLVTADFFFWRPGKDLEKSTEGLFRSLLYEIFRQRPDIIPEILPERWSEASSANPAKPWSVNELQIAMRSIGQHPDLGLSFCFFIDGLDEYTKSLDKYANPTPNIADTIKNLSQTPSIKLCVSSRPWNEFDYAFGGQSDLCLAVHDHTEGDIRAYVNDLLGEHPLFNRRLQADRRHQSIIDSIVTRSQGVFLWVYLIIRALRESLPDRDSFEHLQQRLNEFPSELEPFFDRMLDQIPQIHQEQSSKIILMVLRSLPLWSSMPLSIIHYLTEGKEDIYSMEVTEKPKELMVEVSRDLRARLKARCKDLLVIEDDPKHEHRERIIILHRTVLDYLESERVRQTILARLSAPFSPEIEICRGIIADWKSMGYQWAFLTRESTKRTAIQDPNSWIHMVFKRLCEIIKNLEVYNNSDIIALMDEAQRTMEIYWAGSDIKPEQQDILMLNAIHCRLYPYVESRIVARQISELQGTPNQALMEANYQEWHSKTTRFAGVPALAVYFLQDDMLWLVSLEDADVRTLKVLLDNGADINSSCPSGIQTYWDLVLSKAAEARKAQDDTSPGYRSNRDTFQKILGYWAQIIVLCLEHGASYDHRISKNTNTSSRQIAETAFAGMPDYLQKFGEAATRGAHLIKQCRPRKDRRSIFNFCQFFRLRV